MPNACAVAPSGIEMEHKKSYHSKKPNVCAVAPSGIEMKHKKSYHTKRQKPDLYSVASDGFEIEKPGSSFNFLRPPSSTDERLIIPHLLNSAGLTTFIPDEYCTMPEQLKKLDIDPNLWSNWATSTKERAAELPVYKIGCVLNALASLLICCPCVLYMYSHNEGVIENFREEALTDLNKNVLGSEGFRDAKLQTAEATIGAGEDTVTKNIEWLAIPLTDSDAAILNQTNWKYRYEKEVIQMEEEYWWKYQKVKFVLQDFACVAAVTHIRVDCIITRKRGKYRDAERDNQKTRRIKELEAQLKNKRNLSSRESGQELT